MSQPDSSSTPEAARVFDFDAFPPDTLFFDRRSGQDRREPRPVAEAPERRKKDRRRRIDPTTFEKQYTPDEIEFMNAMQRFKDQNGKPFPTYGEVLRVARGLGYARPVPPECGEAGDGPAV